MQLDRFCVDISHKSHELVPSVQHTHTHTHTYACTQLAQSLTRTPLFPQPSLIHVQDPQFIPPRGFLGGRPCTHHQRSEGGKKETNSKGKRRRKQKGVPRVAFSATMSLTLASVKKKWTQGRAKINPPNENQRKIKTQVTLSCTGPRVPKTPTP